MEQISTDPFSTDPLSTDLLRAADQGTDQAGRQDASPQLRRAGELQAAARRAEAAQLQAMLEYQDRAEADLGFQELPLNARREARKVPVRELALALRMSEHTVTMLLNCARFARRDLPRTWRTYAAGMIDQPRLRMIADAAMPLEDPAHLCRLDADAAEKASAATSAQLRRWLNRYVARLSPEGFSRTCEQAQDQRHVRILHQENGMSLLQAVLPTVTAAAIEKRLRAAARGLDRPQPQDPGLAGETAGGSDTHAGRTPAPDPRTLAQREADLLVAWLLDGRVTGSPVEANIAVLVPEATLTGESSEPALSADRSWALPAESARELAFAQGARHRWYEVVTSRIPEAAEDADADILSVTYTGRFAPRRLRDALAFRDGTCRAEGCTVPAERCDLDHQIPWPEGPTAASNLRALCRRHHRMKSHGYLDPPKPAGLRIG